MKRYDNVIDKLEHHAKVEEDGTLHDADLLKDLKRAISSHRLYLGTDYHSHIKPGSRVADHCITFALSDPDQDNLQTQCSNLEPERRHDEHDIFCDKCEALKTTMATIRDLVDSSVFTNNVSFILIFFI